MIERHPFLSQATAPSLLLEDIKTTAMEITQAIHASISGIQRPIPGFNSVMTSMEKMQEMKVDIPSPSPAMAQSLPLGLPRG